jgi:protease II
MTAHLQAASTSGHPVILDFDYRAGHAGGRPMSLWLRVRAMQLTFPAQQLEMELN